MTDIPILFSAPMIRALLAGRKTMTRRLAWQTPKVFMQTAGGPLEPVLTPTASRRIAVDDRLWVRESIKADRMENLLTGERTTNAVVAYYTADDAEALDAGEFNLSWIWKNKSLPSIHMPRSFSRITLVVDEVKVERLQDITDADAMREGLVEFMDGKTQCFGVPCDGGYEDVGLTPRESFMNLWCTIHGGSAWVENPEVVVVSFKVEKINIDQMAKTVVV